MHRRVARRDDGGLRRQRNGGDDLAFDILEHGGDLLLGGIQVDVAGHGDHHVVRDVHFIVVGFAIFVGDFLERGLVADDRVACVALDVADFLGCG